MRRKITAISLVLTICLFSSCQKENTVINEYLGDNVFNYAVNDACSFVPIENDIYVSFRNSEEVAVYNEVGDKIKSLDFGEGYHTNLCLYDNKIYSFTYGENNPFITVYDLNSSEHTSFKVDTIITSAISMTVVDNNIYLIYWSDSHDEYQESIKFNENDDYSYMGEKAVSISITDFFVTDIDISNVINMKKYSDNEILYYAYDDIGGYYFTIYNTNTKSFSEKIYNNNAGYTFSFCYNDDNKNIVYSDFSNRKLTSISLEPSNTKIDFMPNVVAASGNDIQYANGNCYILDNITGSIYRTEYAKAVKNNKEISFCSSEIYSKVPYGCGYKINTFMLEDDEFALNILAENSTYDICMMSSGQPFSKNIRDKGAFYPLNDVPMVSEYLDSCFPYLKEAATDENGQIWMIPISVDIPYFLYNPKNCAKNNIVFDKNTSWEYLFNKANELYNMHGLSDKYQLNGYQAENNIIDQYNSFYAYSEGGSNFDTELFRNICEMLRKNNMSSESLHTWIMPLSMYDDLNTYYEDYLFELKPYRFSLFEKEAFESLRAYELPDIQDDHPNCADCIYFCVNTNSENLSDTLQYISSYCSYMLDRTDTYMLKDKNRYPFNDTKLAGDLYTIYSDAVINFELSDEMFWEDYQKYSENKIDINEFINEIERKTDMYINE